MDRFPKKDKGFAKTFYPEKPRFAAGWLKSIKKGPDIFVRA